MPYSDHEMLTIGEFATRMKVGRSTVYKWIGEEQFRLGEHFVTLPNGHKRFFWGPRLFTALASKAGGMQKPTYPKRPPSNRSRRINLDI